METFSALLAIYAGNLPVSGEFPAQRPVTRSFDIFFDLRRDKRLSKQSWGWWFETLSCPLWRHCNGWRRFVQSYVLSWFDIYRFTNILQGYFTGTFATILSSQMAVNQPWRMWVNIYYHSTEIDVINKHNETVFHILWDVLYCHCVPGSWFNIKMPSYQYRKYHCGDKTILRPSYLHNEISYTGKTASLYWVRAQVLYMTYHNWDHMRIIEFQNTSISLLTICSGWQKPPQKLHINGL